MAKKNKTPADKQVTAVHILEAITHSPRLITLTPKKRTKTPAAGAVGRPGGLKGTKSEPKTLSERRAASAKKASGAKKATRAQKKR